MSAKKEMSFENALERLEKIVGMLESGDAPLDESLALFEEGVKLVKMCNEKLEVAEASVKKLVNINGEFVEKSFVEEENDEN